MPYYTAKIALFECPKLQICVSRGLITADIYYRWLAGRDVACTEGNEEKWFRREKGAAL